MASRRWTRALIEEEKAWVRVALEPYAGHRARARTRFLLEKLQELGEPDDPRIRARSYVLTMSTLVQHARDPVLSARQVESLIARAEALLQVQKIPTRQSPLSFLYGELHQTTSLIFRREGRLWRSSWEQQMARYMSGPDSLGGEGFAQFSFAHRLLRQGHASLALWHFTEALNFDLEEGQRALAQLGRLRCYRLSGRWDEAERLYQWERPEEEAVQLEWEWEKQCVSCCRLGDFRALRALVGRRKPHYQPSYLVETFFWLHAQKKMHAQSLPKIRSLMKYSGLNMSRLGYWSRIALTFEECLDVEIPLVRRLNQLGKALSQVGKLLNVEQELLVWAASARWLQRVHAFTLATLCLKRYESLSLSLSDGLRQDVLGVVGDLFESGWMSRYRRASSKGP